MTTPMAKPVLRGSPRLQRWLLRLVFLSLVMCGSVLISFSVRHSNQHSAIRQRALQGDDIQLFHLSIRDDVARRVSIASAEVWGRRAELILAEIRENQDDKNSIAADTSKLALLEPVQLLPAGDTKKRALKCVGWRNTADGTPNGPREPEKDMNCTEIVPNNASGYCEVADTKTGEHFQVMRKASNILRNRVPFRCANAPAFARFRVEAHAAMENTTSLLDVANQDLPPRDGIVMVVYPMLIPSAYATIRTLRERLGCSLPIEIWYRPDEMKDPKTLNPLRNLSQNSTISFHPIADPVAKRFVAKIYAIRHSFFDRVLFLDADNVPVRDPNFLFNSPEFLENGALFWPDFWHPDSTIFGLHSRSLLWELLDMPFVDMFEQESGQLLVDRRQHAAPLDLVFFYATHNPNFLVHYKLAWGDKDLFRLAWLKLNATFSMVETPPAMAGMVTELSAFCGMTMVQHDTQGKVLFLHRNKHKLTGKADTNSSESAALSPHADVYPDPAIWTHLLSFDGNFSRDQYVVQAFTTPLNFTTKQKCFGRRSLYYSPQFHVQAVTDLGFAQLEADLRQFAKEATELY